jgi:DNA-binding MarR family transcriptional regulator
MKKKTVKKPLLAQIESPMISPQRRIKAADVSLHPVLEKHLGYCLYKVALKFRSIIDTALADEQLIAPQFGIMNILKASEGINQMTLGSQMGLDKATIVKLIDGLEKQDFVVRVASASDRREKFLKLTTKGLKHLEKMIPRMKALEADFLTPLSAEEKAVIVKAIPKLMQPKKS